MGSSIEVRNSAETLVESRKLLAQLVESKKNQKMQTESDARRFFHNDHYENPEAPLLEEQGSDEKSIYLCTEDKDYTRKINELQSYLDMVAKIVEPGCSQEVLKVALSSMSLLVNTLTFMSTPKPRASL